MNKNESNNSIRELNKEATEETVETAPLEKR